MIVAMIAVRMVQVAVHQVIHVVAVGNRLVAALRTMAMILLMAATGVLGRASSGVGRGDLQDVVINMVAMNVVQMAIVQVIGVAIVLDGGVAATRTMLVGMSLMHLTVLFFHVLTPLFGNLVDGPRSTGNFTLTEIYRPAT